MVETFIKACEDKIIIDTFFIKDYINQEIESRKLMKVLESIKFIKNDKTTLGDYTPELKELRINRTLYASVLLKKYNKHNIYQFTHEEIIILNLEILKTLLHELEHAYQESIAQGINKENECIKKIIISNLSHYNNPNTNLNVAELYNYLPIEHNAEIIALKKADEIIKTSEISNLIKNPNYTKEKLEKLLKENYQNKSIVEIYLEKTQQKIEDYNYKILTKEQKENYGFPLI